LGAPAGGSGGWIAGLVCLAACEFDLVAAVIVVHVIA